MTRTVLAAGVLVALLGWSGVVGARTTDAARQAADAPSGHWEGAIQVPGTGKPIILLADRQTTGGYPKIACVIAPDVAALAQLRPGAKLRFQAVSVEEGTVAHRAFAVLIGNLPALIEAAIPGGAMDSERLLSLNLIGGVVLAGTATGRPDSEGKP